MNRPPFRQSPLAASIKSTSRERVLAQWRGTNLAPVERAGADRSKSAGNLLPRVLQEIGIERKRAETEVLRVWNHILDPNIVAHAQPTGLHKGTLFVTVDSSPWLDEIVRYRRREILERLQNSFGRDLITKISFRVG
ncbi:MAG TPA: DUF721 domain-containing protein [Verrucomicrobiae bacterium]|nr:DUF721 domain-containing protein [Verrucomicrobiae bacterium]